MDMSREQWVLTQMYTVINNAIQGRDLDPEAMPDHFEAQLRDAIRNIALWVEHELGEGVAW